MNRKQRRLEAKTMFSASAPMPGKLGHSPIDSVSSRTLSPDSQGLRAKNRLHVLGVPHTVPHEDYLVCAFTTKILNFPKMMLPFGWDIIEYSNEGSASGSRDHVVVLTRARLHALSLRRSREDPHDVDVNNAPLQDEYQKALMEKIRGRARAGDIVCHVFGPNMEVYNSLPNCHHVETSVGYTASPGLPFRVYESSAWMHWHHGRAGREDGSHYHWVIPSGFDISEWPCREHPGDYALFLGRLTLRKGMNELLEIARRVPGLPFRAYGPGDASQWAEQASPNLTFHGPVFGAERLAVIQNARCMVMPTVFIEPFGNSGVEAQLCGVPLIASSFGAFQETVVEGVTGYRCHTLADWTEAIKLSETLDRRRISETAGARYSREVVGQQYDWAFRQLADLSGRGWYGDRSRKFGPSPDPEEASPSAERRIWLYIPYFGILPSYFQLYLDSLGRNADRVSVIMPTDIDLSCYRLPDNLVPVAMTFEQLRAMIARFLAKHLDLGELPRSTLTNPYKLCDFKILYPEMFYDIGADHGVRSDDFVGWGDCDLIYGRLSDFLDGADDVHLIGGYHAHFTAIRNDSSMRRLFVDVPDLIPQLLHPDAQVVDEKAFRGPLFDYITRNRFRVVDMHLHFCDIVPECFFGLFRLDHASRTKNFFDAYNPSKDIDHVTYDATGRLTVAYDDRSTRSASYCHLQKRRMTLNGIRVADGFLIREDGFYPSPL
ncbi:MAG: DUF6625 family protein [Janthinobacterium lividum]